MTQPSNAHNATEHVYTQIIYAMYINMYTSLLQPDNTGEESSGSLKKQSNELINLCEENRKLREQLCLKDAEVTAVLLVDWCTFVLRHVHICVFL